MITTKKFIRNIAVHTSHVPFGLMIGVFLGMTAVNLVAGHPGQASLWVLGLCAMLMIAGFLGDDDDDPQHPVPGWDPAHRVPKGAWS